MTLHYHFGHFRAAKRHEVLDWKRFELAWGHYTALHPLEPCQWTHQATDAATAALPHAPGTLRRDLGCLSVFAKWLKREGLIASMPDWKMPSAPAPRQRYVSAEEMRRILATPAEMWFVQATRLAILTGQRIGAILDLKWTQIRGGVIDFNFGVSGRCKKRGTVPLTAGVREVLGGCALGDRVINDELPVNYFRYLREWRRVCKACGIEGATPHMLRHGVATELVAAGVPLLEVSKLLGHADVSTTQRVYAKFAPEFTLRATETMGGLVG